MREQLRVVITVARDGTLARIQIAYLGFKMAEYATWIAILVYAYGLGGSGTAALVAMIQLVPSGIVAPFAAYAGDRYPRDRVLVAGYVWQGLSLGADDYLVKPFSPQELVLRVRNILRRSHVTAADRRNVQRIGNVEIDKDAHTVSLDGAPLDLTATEYKLLTTLADRRGRVQSRAQLLEMVWESAPDIQTRTVDMHVQRLRAKLGAAGDLIETVRGFGYRLKRGADARCANGIV